MQFIVHELEDFDSEKELGSDTGGQPAPSGDALSPSADVNQADTTEQTIDVATPSGPRAQHGESVTNIKKEVCRFWNFLTKPEQFFASMEEKDVQKE